MLEHKTFSQLRSDDESRLESKTESSRRLLGWLFLLGAVLLTIGSAVIFFIPMPTVVATPDERGDSRAEGILPTIEASAQFIDGNTLDQPTVIGANATLTTEQIASILSTPVVLPTQDPVVIVRNIYDPFTYIPERPRSSIIEYTAVAGDTIGAIAERFGLKPETVAWSNPRAYIQILQPGNLLNILPVDGVLHTVLVEQTISSVAELYRVDPYTIIDSEYNNLAGASPDTLLTSNTRLIVPGGTGEQISWTPQVIRVAAGDGQVSSNGGQISFSPGDPGSCGLVDNPGSSGVWVRPLSGYAWVRGYAAWHPAADLSVPEGTSVIAASSGRVIFAGWNSFGYGYAVVLAHGPFTTIYAHLSAVNVRCGQDVSAGQLIGASGNTGNSSGPHLHFEVRYNDTPQDPALTVAL